MYPWNSAYLGEKKAFSWDMNTLIGQQNKIYQPMEEPIDEGLTKDKETATFTPTHKEHIKVVLYSLKCTVWVSTRYPPLGVMYKLFEAHR